jgi:hypothetical protein
MPTWHDGTAAPYAIDNGAWGAYASNREWDAGAFLDLAAELGEGADWVAIPDIVAGGLESLRRSEEWKNHLRYLLPETRLLLPVQDGMAPLDVASLIDDNTGIFLGGSTEWKLDTLPSWGEWCEERDVYFHVARVNTVNRIEKCANAKAQSFDGTNLSKYASNSERLQWARYCNPSRRHPWQKS